MRVPISVRTNYKTTDVKALVDSGATDNFISPDFARQMGLGSTPLERPRKVWNIDNTENRAGSITHSITLDVQTNGKWNDMVFLVTELGAEDLLLGYPWLATYEPRISWRLATPFRDTLPIIIRSRKGEILMDPTPPTTSVWYMQVDAPTEAEKQDILSELEKEHGIHTLSTDLAIVAQKDQPKVTLPPQYQQFAHLFNEE